MTRSELVALIAGVEFARMAREMDVPHHHIADNAEFIRRGDDIAGDCIVAAETAVAHLIRQWDDTAKEPRPDALSRKKKK